jgi:LCP family protein required for cell wall assembly
MKKVAIRFFFFFIGLLLLALILIKPYYSFVTDTLGISPIKALFFEDSLKTFDGQVNILLLGIAGQDHDGPNLSDSIFVINYNLLTNKVTTISVPRDIWSATLRDKINSAYAYGEAKKPGQGGFILAKSEVSSIVGQPIHYAAAIDFNRFREIVDFLGGIEVNVQRSFTDKKFPITGRENDDCDGDRDFKCRYETISFTKGTVNMSGETALKYVRSRNSEGPEGSDFAREVRQQNALEAVKDKIITYVKKPNLNNYDKLYSLLDNLIKRDITNQQIAFIFRNLMLKGYPARKAIALTEDLFITPDISDEYDYRWVLVPSKGSFDPIHALIRCELVGIKKCLN